LAGGADRAEDDGRYREIEIGGFVHDDGVVAAELEQALAQALGHAHAHLPAHVSRAGEGDQCDAFIVDEAGREFGPGVDEQLENRRQRMAFEHAIADVLHGERAQRGFGGGLPDHDIAADGGEERIPGPHRHGEVERRDHAHDTQRMPLLVHPVLGSLRMHGVAVQHAGLAHREVGDVDHLLHLAVALGLDLAVLERHQAAERVLVQPQLFSHQAHDLAALRCRYLTPLLGGVHRGRQHLLVVLAGGAANLRQPLAGGGIQGFDQRPGRIAAPAVASRPSA
jgi:hypothetical protein